MLKTVVVAKILHEALRISFFNDLPFVFMRGGTIHGRTSFVILCNASTKRNEQWATTYFTFRLHRYFQVEKQRFT